MISQSLLTPLHSARQAVKHSEGLNDISVTSSPLPQGLMNCLLLCLFTRSLKPLRPQSHSSSNSQGPSDKRALAGTSLPPTMLSHYPPHTLYSGRSPCLLGHSEANQLLQAWGHTGLSRTDYSLSQIPSAISPRSIWVRLCLNLPCNFCI